MEVLTISRPGAYGEYAPYIICESEDKLIDSVNRIVERRQRDGRE